jgi:aryl-phospho-beta-D-glucosidase BglC (GH1 family)
MNMSSKVKRFAITLTTLLVIVATAFGFLATQKASAQTQAQFRVDAAGNITKNGALFRVKGGSWFGLQGRYEPASDAANPRGAPMEQYMGNVFWAPTSRTYDIDIAEMKALGINVIRLPLSHQTLNAADPQGNTNLKNNPTVVIANSRLALETIAKKIDAAGISIMWDIHSCSNYVDWRKGRLDARPPYVDATRDNYDFKREDSSCASSNNPASVTRIQAYDTATWLADLQLLAGFSNSLGLVNVIGIDIFNEPWDYTWAEWSGLTTQAYNTINAANPNLLIFMQGISGSNGNQDGSPTTIGVSPAGSSGVSPNWGENLFEAGGAPPAGVPKSRLVFTPHAYGPSVFVGHQFADPAVPACVGLEGDAFGDAHCQIVLNTTLLRAGWDAHFGYLKAMGYAVVIGEWGGNMDWPHGAASQRDIDRFGYLANNNSDRLWQEAFRDYLISKCILDTVYWSINPESGDTGGLYSTPYTEANKTAWGTWGAWDTRKTALVQTLWNNTTCNGPIPTPTKTSIVNTPTKTLTPPPGFTPTRTNTPPAVFTPTRTITPNGFTPTRTNTPFGVTNTPTRVPLTATPTQGTGGACTPVTSTITAPFTLDGAGTFCWQIAAIPGYVNSWNTTTVSINGVNFSNLYVATGGLPAKINNNYYVYYVGPFAWSHIEIR